MSTTFAIDARTADSRFPGIGRYVKHLLLATTSQLRDDERVVYLCSERQKVGLALPDLDRVRWARAVASPFGGSQQWQIPRLLRANEVDVYHSPYYLMPYWLGVPTIVTVYDLIPQLFPEYVSLRARLFFKVTTHLAVSRAARVIAISDATRQDYIAFSHVDRSRVTAVPLAAAPHFEPASDARIEKVKQKHKLPAEYILYLGSNKPHKNLVRLVQAWQEVLEQLESSHDLVIAGYWDPRYSEVCEEVRRLDLESRVHIVRSVADEDLAALYSGADLFVFPSLYEGFGLPVLEAMACGCAVACSNRSSLPEIVGDAAVRFDPQKIEEIAQSISALLQDHDRRQKYRRRSHQRAAAFSWDHTAAETLKIYREVAQL